MKIVKSDRPGYKTKAGAEGIELRYWIPARAIKGAPIDISDIASRAIPSDVPMETVNALCTAWTQELFDELLTIPVSSEFDPRIEFDGTIASLISCYRRDPSSPYQGLKHTSRQRDYEPSLRMIEAHVGERAVGALRGSDFKRWYENWLKRGQRTAHGAIRKVRAILSYGVAEKLPGCQEAREILAVMKFAAPKPRKVALTYEWAQAIVAEAIRRGAYSLALTQALQWDSGLRRIHIIGEWQPGADGSGGVIRGGSRWIGPTVADIDQDGVFRPSNISGNKAAPAHDLSGYPMVQAVLAQMALPKFGPLIVNENTGLPYWNREYTKLWRTIAKEVGVPDDVWSMDTRAGAVTEVEEALGISIAGKFAGHSNPRTTLGYVRDDGVKVSRLVADARRKMRES